MAIEGGPPPEFGGTEGRWSPEHLLVSAAALCYLTTLEWFSRGREVSIAGFECRAEGTVEKTRRGLAFTSVHMNVAATAPPGRSAELRELMEMAKDACLVANSLACPVELVAEVAEE